MGGGVCVLLPESLVGLQSFFQHFEPHPGILRKTLKESIHCEPLKLREPVPLPFGKMHL